MQKKKNKTNSIISGELKTKLGLKNSFKDWSDSIEGMVFALHLVQVQSLTPLMVNQE